MQRIGLLVLGLFFAASGAAAGQQAPAGSTLWRVAATTLPIPTALATGAAAAFWNPAQVPDSAPARLQLAFEAIQTPSAVDATGMIATVRASAGRFGQVGLLYGRVGLSDLTQRSEEHTSELQSPCNLVCRLLLEKKKKQKTHR